MSVDGAVTPEVAKVQATSLIERNGHDLGGIERELFSEDPAHLDRWVNFYVRGWLDGTLVARALESETLLPVVRRLLTAMEQKVLINRARGTAPTQFDVGLAEKSGRVDVLLAQRGGLSFVSASSLAQAIRRHRVAREDDGDWIDQALWSVLDVSDAWAEEER